MDYATRLLLERATAQGGYAAELAELFHQIDSDHQSEVIRLKDEILDIEVADNGYDALSRKYDKLESRVEELIALVNQREDLTEKEKEFIDAINQII